jgi:hypothetical protein
MWKIFYYLIVNKHHNLNMLPGRMAPYTHSTLCSIHTCQHQADPDCYREAKALSEYTESFVIVELKISATLRSVPHRPGAHHELK